MFESLRRKANVGSIIPHRIDYDKIFAPIVGLEAAKRVVIRSLDTPNRTVTHLVGPPASGKSLIARLICDNLDGWYYFDCSGNSSSPGIIDFLEDHRNAKGVCFDEIDKMKKNDQAMLYNFMEEGGHIYRSLKKQQIHFSMPECKVLATSNSTTKYAKPFLSRFLTLRIPAYTYDEFLMISENLLARYRIPSQTARDVGDLIWNVLESRDVRMINHIGQRLNPKDSPSEMEQFAKDLLELSMQKEGVDYN